MDKLRKSDEILYMDDVGEEAATPLTVQPLEARVRPRSNSMGTTTLLEKENEGEPRLSLPRLELDAEADAVEPKPIGFDSRALVEEGPLPERPSTIDPRIPLRPYPFFPQPPLVSTPDVNVYQHKKTLAQGMMDLALLSANANQLRYVLQTDGGHPYYYPSLAMIGASLLLQIAVGIGLIWNSRYNVKDDVQMFKADRANNWTVIGIFLVTILNVFISSFGVVDQVSTTAAS